MKCISLWQPWASLVVLGLKRVETRGRRLLPDGPLLIHATKEWNLELAELCRTEPFKTALMPHVADATFWDTVWGRRPARRTTRPVLKTPLPLGQVIGRVSVVRGYPTERVRESGLLPGWQRPDVAGDKLEINWIEKAFGDYSPGRWAFLLIEATRLTKPIPVAGHQAVFQVPDSLIPPDEGSTWQRSDPQQSGSSSPRAATK